jgi:hypothetical protein
MATLKELNTRTVVANFASPCICAPWYVTMLYTYQHISSVSLSLQRRSFKENRSFQL